jgi:hypothetical protein
MRGLLRSVSILSCFLVLLLAIGVNARADVPCCPSCETTIDAVGRVLLVPDGNGNTLGEFTVIAKNIWTGAIVPHAVVEVLFGGYYSGKIRVCGGQTLTKTADANGIAHFAISGGGCSRTTFDLPAMVIRVMGVECRAYDVLSPDYSGWDNAGEPNRWSLSMDPTDLAAFARAYQGGTGPASCHDYNSNGVTDATDLSVFAQAYHGGVTSCSP